MIEEIESIENIHLFHAELMREQGRKISWVARNVDCSESLLYKYFKGYKVSKKKVQKIHSLLSNSH